MRLGVDELLKPYVFKREARLALLALTLHFRMIL